VRGDAITIERFNVKWKEEPLVVSADQHIESGD
jgi:hypothetical protein